MRDSQTKPLIEFKNVSKSFGEKVVLEDISFQVHKGETFCLIGGSGAGKSITLKLLLGLEFYDAGEIFYKTECVGEMDHAQLRKMRYEMGMLFQGSALFDSMTVAENIAYPVFEQKKIREEEKIHEIVKEKLKLVSLHDIENFLPADLSGGMKKRVGLARALATDPEVILYDEPTAGLDPTNVNRIDSLIEGLQKKLGVTSIVVTHHMPSVFKIADRVALLYDKKIQFEGSARELLQSKNPFVHKFIEGTIGLK